MIHEFDRNTAYVAVMGYSYKTYSCSQYAGDMAVDHTSLFCQYTGTPIVIESLMVRVMVSPIGIFILQVLNFCGK